MLKSSDFKAVIKVIVINKTLAMNTDTRWVFFWNSTDYETCAATFHNMCRHIPQFSSPQK